MRATLEPGFVGSPERTVVSIPATWAVPAPGPLVGSFAISSAAVSIDDPR